MVVRMRHTRAHTRNRRSHHALTAPTLSKCGHCGASVRPHHMCQACGYYKGRMVLDLAARKTSRDARIRANRERTRADAATAPAKTETVEQAPIAAEEKPEKKPARTRSVKTGTSSKKEKQETS